MTENSRGTDRRKVRAVPTDRAVPASTPTDRAVGRPIVFKLLLNGTAVGTVNDVVDGARDKERDAASGMLSMIEIRTMRVVLRSGCLPDRRS